jgi:putative membrane protein
VATVVVTIAIGGCSNTPSEQPARGVAVGTGGAAADARSDGEFVHDVAVMNMAGIELSRMALEKAASPELKTFAQTLIDEHEAAADRLKGALSGHTIEWPAQLDEKHREIAGELAEKQGDEFDADYTEAMIEGHQDLAARLESRLDVQSLADWKTAAAARTQNEALPDPESRMRDVQVRPNNSGNDLTMKINRWAAEMYPVAQKHLDTARQLENAAKKRVTN